MYLKQFSKTTLLCTIVNLLIINIGLYCFSGWDAIIPMVVTSVFFVFIFIPALLILSALKIKFFATFILSVVTCTIIAFLSIFISSWIYLFCETNDDIIVSFFKSIGLMVLVIVNYDGHVFLATVLFGLINTFWINKARQALNKN